MPILAKTRLATLLMAVGGLLTPVANSAEPTFPVREIALGDFALSDPTPSDKAGPTRPLAAIAGQRGLVIVFVGTECPLVRAYLPKLLDISRAAAEQGFGVVAVDANVQDTPEELAALEREFSLPFLVLVDTDRRLARALGATRTPEAFVLDPQGKVQYRGQIDDQYGLGYQRAEPKNRYLADAIASLADGRPVATPVTEPVGCVIGGLDRDADTSPVTGDVTYSNQIVRLLAKNCVACHRQGDIAPFALDNYEEAAAWAESCVEAIDDRRMPPWFASPEHGTFANERRLSDEEKSLFRAWVEAGCPEGDRSRLPAAGELAVAEELFVPDVVYPMSDKPFDVPATGNIDYQTYAIDPGWTEDKWIKRAEIYAGERSVVHHVLLFVQRPGVRYPGVYPGELIGGFVPGRRGETMPDELAFHIPAGSKIVFQMHYTPNGVARTDMTHVGFKFADPSKVQFIASARRAINVMFQIPPRDANYEAKSRYVFDNDAVLLSLTPHMHVRGRTFKYEAIFPDGRRETLLEVPRWDFNWQMDYMLTEPLAIPKGTVLECTATYDNSDANPANPDPSRWVTFGEQTYQEMLIGFFAAAEAVDQPAPPPEEIAKAIGELVRHVRTKTPEDTRIERVGQFANNSLEVLRTAGEVARIRESREIAELQHVIQNAMIEAKKQGAIGQTTDRAARRERALTFMMNSANVLRELAAESKMSVTKVEPVAWPLESVSGGARTTE